MTTQTVGRLAAVLSRQAPAQAMTIETIADDAVRLAQLGMEAREALERRRSPRKFVKGATAIAQRYGAELVDQRDLDGAVMCLKFNAGLYRSGFRNLFYIA